MSPFASCAAATSSSVASTRTSSTASVTSRSGSPSHWRTLPRLDRPPRPPGLELAIVDPLLRLHAEYVGAAARIQGIITGLERVAAGAMKGQHRGHGAHLRGHPSGRGATGRAGPGQRASPPEGEDEFPPRKVSVEVHGKGFGALLDFQEKLSSVAGVSRVSINAIDAERATLIVELHGGESQDE